MSTLRVILIDGRPHLWADILRQRREQLAASRHAGQPALFEPIDDHRPASQMTAAGRYSEPSLFERP
jgi:hypothetical protein